MADKKLRLSEAKKLALEQKKHVENPEKLIKKTKIPPTIALLYEALIELDNKTSNGSSFKAIKKFIATKYEVVPKNLTPTCKQIMKQEINLGNIIQVGRKFLLTRQNKRVPRIRAKKRPKNKLNTMVNKDEEGSTN